ncbi:MAG: hypothetical protein WKF73_01120 [Nocardioidaceae bacterium]
MNDAQPHTHDLHWREDTHDVEENRSSNSQLRAHHLWQERLVILDSLFNSPLTVVCALAASIPDAAKSCSVRAGRESWGQIDAEQAAAWIDGDVPAEGWCALAAAFLERFEPRD